MYNIGEMHKFVCA